jgi:hypothetical protein
MNMEVTDSPQAQSIYGYFTDPFQAEPVYDPDLDVPCQICAQPLDATDVRTISLMVPDDTRSYFYRVHRSCHEPLSETERCSVDGLLVDAIYSARNVN